MKLSSQWIEKVKISKQKYIRINRNGWTCLQTNASPVGTCTKLQLPTQTQRNCTKQRTIPVGPRSGCTRARSGKCKDLQCTVMVVESIMLLSVREHLYSPVAFRLTSVITYVSELLMPSVSPCRWKTRHLLYLGLLNLLIFVEDFFNYKDGEIFQSTYRHSIIEM